VPELPSDDRCSQKGCKRPSALRYLGRWLCQYHWELICREAKVEPYLKEPVNDHTGPEPKKE
jgi:hypothetical protein